MWSRSRYTPASELPSPPPNPLATPPNLEDLGFDDPRPLHNDAFFRRSASPQSPISQQSSEGIATSPSDDATLSPFATNRAVPARRVVVQGTIGTGGPSESSESTTAPPHPPASQAGTSNNDASHNVQAAEDFAPLPHTTGASAEPPTTDPSSPNTPRPNIYNPAARAVLVARLLSVASAATAASLLPGRIVVGGRTVDSFPGLDAEQTQPSPGVADESGSARPEPVRASASSGFIPPSPVPVSENMPSEPTTPQRPSIRSRSSSAPSTPSRTYPSFRSLFQRPSAQRPASSNTSDSTSPQHSPTSASETSDSVHRSGALMVSRPSLRNQPMPDAQAPEGSFERFLSDLQTEVSLAILRDHFIPRRSASANGEPEEREAFSFFRSYRFGDRVMDAAGNLHEAESEDSSTSPSTVSPAPSQSPETRETSSDQRSPSSSPSPTSPPGNRVAPLLLVGVRSVPSRQLQSESNPAETPPFDGVDPFHLMGQGIETHRQRSPLQESDRLYPFASPLSGVPSPGSQPSSTTNETVPLLEPDSQPRASTFNESPVVSRGEVDIAADSQDMEFDSLRDRPPSSLTSYHTADGGATSSPNSGHSSPQDQQAPPPRPQPNASRRPERDFIIWIAGGVYPASHPLLLLSDLDQADYNDLIRLAEFIGNVKRSTATESEVEQSGLKLLLPNELPALLEKGEVLSNTTERCLVCLEDYADAPEASVRLLECRHAFHKYVTA